MERIQGILNEIVVQAPCRAAWEQMSGTDAVRYCHECNLNVYNLSVITAPDAEALLTQHQGPLCARLLRRRDGAVITTDGTYGRRRFLGRVYYALAAILAMVGLTSCVSESLGSIDCEKTTAPPPKPEAARTDTGGDGHDPNDYTAQR